MISGANEQELELANARANIVMKLDNTSTYESWLIIDTHLEQLEKENQELKEQNKKEFADYIKFKKEQHDEYLEKINKLIKENQELKKQLIGI